MNNELIPPYSPLWQGDSQCNKCDVIIIPQNAEFVFALPTTENLELERYIVTMNVDGVDYDWSTDQGEGDGYTFNAIAWTFDKLRAFVGDTLDLLDVAGQCYDIRLRLRIAVEPRGFEYVEAGAIGQVYFPTQDECNDRYRQINYRLFCDQTDDFITYQDAYLATLPLTLADEVNAVDGNGRNRRIFSRLQGNKELRVRPLTLATHELLEHVLNLPSFVIDGVEYTQAEGGIYTFVDSGSSGYYVGRVELSATGKVMRLCCEEISPSS